MIKYIMKLKNIIEDLFEEKQAGTYIGMHLSKSSNDDLSQYLKEKKIPNPVPSDKLHATVLYSRKPCPTIIPKGMMKLGVYATPTNMDIWETKDDKKALVLELNSPELIRRHKYFIKEHGGTHDYDEYKPHITLSYDVEDFDISNIDMYNKKIIFNEEYLEYLDEEWTKK